MLCEPQIMCLFISLRWHLHRLSSLSLYNPNGSSYCGYPGLQIHCYNYETPILFLGSDNYTITHINNSTKTISLVDSEIILQNTQTPRVDHNVSLTHNTWLNYTDLIVNLTLFLDCPEIPSNLNLSNSSINPVDSVPGKYSYVFPAAAIPSDYYSEGLSKCKKVVFAPVLGNKMNSQVLNLSAAYGSLLADGFQLEWSDAWDSGYCMQCEKRGGQCGYNVTRDSSYNLTCFCCGTYNLFFLFFY
jgi:Wall-associated receptor kinase C-terminal/Wall-associated receptor kinase galacturonan-binding